jgi:hypothetical protein
MNALPSVSVTADTGRQQTRMRGDQCARGIDPDRTAEMNAVGREPVAASGTRVVPVEPGRHALRGPRRC